MRIAHLYKDYPPILGGIENHVRLLAEGQAARGHQVWAFVTNPAGPRSYSTEENGVHVVRAARLATVASTPLSLTLPWQLLHSIPDVVHLHFPYPVGEISQWALRRGEATVLTYHSDIVRQAGILRFYQPLLARILRFVDAIVVGSPPMQESVYLRDHRTKVRLIPYGIPLTRFENPPSEEERARVASRYPDVVQLRAEHDEGVLLFVGRLRYYKGLDTLIQALPHITARLLVVGTGPMGEAWRGLALQSGVAERIVWLGEVPDADLSTLYHLADLFVLPASHPSEAFGLVQVEAMAAGLPVVCTELGTGTSYVNKHGVTGLVVPPRDPDALATAVNSLLLNAESRHRMGIAARARVAAEFDLNGMVERVLALYQEVTRKA